MKSAFLLVPAMALLALLPLRAATILNANGSFEDAPNGSYSTSTSNSVTYDFASQGTGPTLTTGADTTLVTGWTATTIGNGSSFGLLTKNIFSPSEATTGDEQALFLQVYFGGSTDTLMSDSLGTILPNSTYTLSFDLGTPTTFSVNGKATTSGYTAPQVFFALLGNGSNVINSTTLVNTTLTSNGLTNYTLSFATGATGGYVGQTLSIELQAKKADYPANTFPTHSDTGDPGGEMAIFDNVVLTGPDVPEPSTYALMLAAGALLVFLARRRMMRS